MLDQTSSKSHKVGQEGYTESHLMIYAKIQKEHFLEVRPFALVCAFVRSLCAPLCGDQIHKKLIRVHQRPLESFSVGFVPLGTLDIPRPHS